MGPERMVLDRIEREIVVDAPVDRVWAVVTEPAHVARWFGSSAEIDLRPGGEMRFGWEGYGVVHAVVERVEPPHRFSFRWARPTEDGPRPGNSTLVEFSLTAEGERTRLRVVESGFRALAWPEGERTGYFEGNTRGWASELGELLEYVATLAA